jgi:hypothetical protein
MKLRLTIDIEYEPHGVAPQELADHLLAIADHAASVGSFTGETPAEVEEWSAKVEPLG